VFLPPWVQPLFGLLLLNGLRTDLLGTSTLTICPPLAKFSNYSLHESNEAAG